MRKLLIHMMVLALAGIAPAWAGNAPSDVLDPTAIFETEKPMLNEHIVVESNVVRLGDLFTNAGTRAEAAVAYSPAAGQRSVLDARWLYRVARAYKIDWKPLGATTQVVVERGSISIPQDEIKTQILFALSDQGVSEDMDVELASRFQQVFLPAGNDPTVNVEDINYQERTGRFVATMSAGQAADFTRIRLTGRVFRSVEVPVLRARVLRGDVITKGDVQWIKMKAERVQRDVIVDFEDLIGMTPKRGIRAGSPIRRADVRRPVMVEKNSLVTIFHKVPNLVLTAQGKALQSGSDGDIVQIKNQRSNQVIEAEVIAPGRVAVRSLSDQLAYTLN